jgi:predicted transcriptional regulator
LRKLPKQKKNLKNNWKAAKVKQKRTQYEIYWEILTFCRKPKSFTSIINRCNLNSKIGQKHIKFLKKKGFLTTVEDQRKALLIATERANDYMTLFNQIYRKLFDNSPEFRL